MTNAFAEQMQQARDLRTQLTGLERDDESEIQFTEWSPGRKMVRLWSVSDGTEILIPRYMVMPALTKRLPDGRYAFTANKEDAPTFKDGNVKCFLAEGSPERESGLLAAAGLDHLPSCPAKTLRSVYSKRTHAKNRHSQSWLTLQEHLNEERYETEREERRQQLEATLAIAGRAVNPTGVSNSTNEHSESDSDSTTATTNPRRGRPRKG